MIFAHSITTELVGLLRKPVPAPLRQIAARHLLDWLGCAFFGLRSAAARPLMPYAEEAPSGKTTAIGIGQRYLEPTVFYNGCLGNLAEMDDVHRTSILHPGPVVIPAALALAEELGASPAALLDAIVRGYEAMIRIGAALGPKHYAFFHNTSTAGSFGAAAACADLLGLKDEAFVSALGNAGTRTGGLWQMRHENVMSKALHNGQAAHSGLLAAMLAKRGFTGPAYILEGPQGLFQATAPDGNPARIVLDMGDTDWRIKEVSFKPWAACRHVHPAIDAALKLRTHLRLDADILAVRVDTYADAVKFCDKQDPHTENEAKFSIQHAVATVLIKGKPGLDDFSPPFSNDRINKLRGKIRVYADDLLSKNYPEHYGARVAVKLSDGSVESHAVIDAWGDPALPLSVAEVESKAHQLMLRAGLNANQVDGLFDAVRALPTATTLRDFSLKLRTARVTA
jgi:2-methylcitrate dehydratase PrpD